MNGIKIQYRKVLPGLLLIAASVLPAVSVTANRPVNRVRPPENSEQFAKEAARVRLERLGERLNLSKSQMLKMREAQLKKEEKLKKQESKLKKAEEKFNSDKKKIESEENKIMSDYQSDIQKTMTADQWEAYQMILKQEAEAERQIEPPTTDPGAGPQQIETEGGFTGEPVKTPGPQKMYGN